MRRRCGREGLLRSSVAVVVRTVVALLVARLDIVRVGLVVPLIPDPLGAAPRPLTGDPVVARHGVIVLGEHDGPLVVVVVAVLDPRPLHVDRTANDARALDIDAAWL